MITEQDKESLLILCKRFHCESRMKDILLDLDICWETIYRATQNPDRFLRVYRDEGGGIKGLFIGALVPLFFSKEYQAQDLVFYLDPFYRGSSWFPEVLKEFELWAKVKGASKVIIYHDTGINTEQAPKLLNRFNYEQTGFCFSKDIKCVEY